jgi:type II secretory pathway component GspD/PulD (secretin)
VSSKFMSDKRLGCGEPGLPERSRYLMNSGSRRARRGRRGGAVRALALVAACGGTWGAALGQVDDLSAPATTTPAAQPIDPAAQPDETITLSGFSGPVELKALLDFAVDELQINLWIDPNLAGQVTLNAPVTFPKSDLLFVLDTILEGYGYSILPAGIPNTYTVRPSSSVKASIGPGLSTTQIIETPNVKPSSLKVMLDAQFGGGAGTGDGGGGSVKVSYLDDAGFIVATGTPASVRSLQSLVNAVLEKRGEEQFFRIELTHINPTTAIEQATQLLGLASNTLTPNPNQPAPTGLSPALANLKDRLRVGTQGNALVFRGRPGELEEVQNLIEMIDQPSSLPFKRFFTGSETLAIAELASKQGLGDVVRLTGGLEQQQGAIQQQLQNLQRGLGQQPTSMGGSKLVVAEQRGWVYYFGTEAQQERLAQLVDEFKAKDELSVVDVYKLHHSDAEEVADIINGLLEGALPQAGSPLLAQGQRGPNQQPLPSQFTPPEGEGEGEENGFNPGQGVFVIADVANNQIIVRAPRKQQREFERLIGRLDLRRPQVYLEAQIVAINATEDYRLRFESQIVTGQFGFSSLFGAATAGDTLTDPLTVPGGLLGATAGLIKSEYVPLIIHALQQDADGRILASPKLLVNDNDETTIVNVDRFPTSTLSQTANSTLTSFSGEQAEAGTTFTVLPRISSGDYINLEYSIELSAFTGPPPFDGAPPPSQVTNIDDGSVTVPGGATIVVGGLSFENISDTIVKIPLLGDIPLIGHLFRDTQRSTQVTTIYVFITPRIMRDAAFRDITILTQGPQAEMQLAPDVPSLEPVMMRLQVTPTAGDSGTVRRREGGG